jgi:hypothetical protein
LPPADIASRLAAAPLLSQRFPDVILSFSARELPAPLLTYRLIRPLRQRCRCFRRWLLRADGYFDIAGFRHIADDILYAIFAFFALMREAARHDTSDTCAASAMSRHYFRAIDATGWPAPPASAMSWLLAGDSQRAPAARLRRRCAVSFDVA